MITRPPSDLFKGQYTTRPHFSFNRDDIITKRLLFFSKKTPVRFLLDATTGIDGDLDLIFEILSQPYNTVTLKS